MLLNQEQAPGDHELNLDVGDIDPGIFFCVLYAGDLFLVRKLVVK